MDEDGKWVKVYRRTRKDKIWFAEKFSKGQAWIDLSLRARFAIYEFFKRGIKVILKPGQLAESEESLASDWGWSRQKVRRFLQYLEADGKIVQQKSRLISIITIVDWDIYQQNDTTNKTTNDTTIQKNLKKEKDIYPPNSSLEKQNSLFEQLWKNYPVKVGRKDAMRHFLATVKTEADHALIQQAFKNYMNSQRVKDGFIQNGSRWFKQWRDWVDYKEPVKKASNVA